jgi:regulatory protein
VDRLQPRSRQPRKNKPELSLRARALGMLARREHTRRELAAKLARYTEDREEVGALLDDFERRGWLSEQRYAEQVATARRRRFGTQRIAHEMRQKGVSEAVISGALPALMASELETARAVWRRKFQHLPVDARERARQVRFLQGRGFTVATAMRVIGGAADEDNAA